MSSPFQKLLGRMATKNIPSIVEQEAIQKAEQAAERGVVPYVHQADEVLQGEVGQHIPGNSGGGFGGGDIIDATASHIDDGNLPALIPQATKQGWSNTDKALTALGLGTVGAAGYDMLSGTNDQSQVPSPMALPSDQPTRQVSSQPAPQTPAPAPVIKPVSDMTMSAPSIAPKTAPQQSMDMDFGTGHQDTAQALQQAQDQENQIVLLNQLGKAANTFSAGLAGSGAKVAGNENFDAGIEQAHNLTKQQQARMEKSKNDPNSPLSQGMRRFMQAFGFNIKGEATADELMKLSPLAEKYYQSVQNREEKGREFDLKQKELGLKREELDQNRQNKASEKKTAQDVARLDRVGKQVIAELASSRSTFGKDSQTVASVQNARALLNGETNLDNIDNRQIVEMSRVLDRILSQGSPTVSTTEHLTPNTARMKVAKSLEFLTNKRQGAGAGNFIKTTAATLDKEEKTAKERLGRTAGKILAPAADLKDNPTMQSILRQNDLPDDIWDYMGPNRSGSTDKEKGSAKYTQAQQTKIRIFMKNNPEVKTPEDAAKILDEHGHL